MRRSKRSLLAIMAVLLAIGLVVSQPRVVAEVANGPSLIISQLKITSSNGQFVTLYNNTNTPLDMSKYQVEYFNHYDLSKATSSRLISLTGIVPPHGYFMVNDSALLLCYQLTVDSVSLGFSSTTGMVEVLAFNQSSIGGSVVPVLQDYVGWSKTAANGAQTLPSSTSAFLQRQPADSVGNPLVSSPGAGSWQNVQPDNGSPCNLTTVSVVPLAVATGLSLLLPGAEPPATILSVIADSGDPTPSLPAVDIGLMAPQVTELLPNPEGTGNDSSDEFIELYNPNAKSFDLSGFSLQVGLTTLHKYVFPAGSTMPPKSFKAFYSETTSLSLSNSGSQAKLLDPFGNSISASQVYGTAKNGQAWALAKGKWYWTTTVTPDKQNVIKLPPVTKKSAAKQKVTTKGGTKVKGAKTTKSFSTAAAAGPGDEAETAPVHTAVLAVIAGLALLYGAYEYRADLANRVHQFRRYFKARGDSRF